MENEQDEILDSYGLWTWDLVVAWVSFVLFARTAFLDLDCFSWTCLFWDRTSDTDLERER